MLAKHGGFTLVPKHPFIFLSFFKVENFPECLASLVLIH